MTGMANYCRKTWSLVRSDLRREFRAPAVLPSVLLLGFLVVAVLSMQLDGPVENQPRMAASLLWLAIFFAGIVSVEQSFAGEREGGCWDALRLYPVAPSVIFTAKLTFNFFILSLLSVVLFPLFAMFGNAPLFLHPGELTLLVIVANAGLAAAGTLVAAITNGLRVRGHLTALLLLPLVLPVLLGGGDATRLLMLAEVSADFWQWLQLLAVFAVVFITAGVLACDYLMED